MLLTKVMDELAMGAWLEKIPLIVLYASYRYLIETVSTLSVCLRCRYAPIIATVVAALRNARSTNTTLPLGSHSSSVKSTTSLMTGLPSVPLERFLDWLLCVLPLLNVACEGVLTGSSV